MKLVDIIGFKNFYKISDTGRLYSIQSNKFRKLSSISNCGYLRIDLYKNGKCSYHSLHRLVAIAFISNPNNYKYVNHKDGNKLNNNVKNLEWVTSSENSLHRSRILGKVTGEKHGMSKLKLKEIRAIRNLIKAGYKKPDVAEIYNITVRTVYHTINKDTWR